MQRDTQQQQQAERIDVLIQQVATLADPQARTMAQELVQCTMAMYGDCLARMLEVIGQSELAGTEIIAALGADELVGPLLLLHGLHPVDMQTRIQRALEEQRPYLQKHGGDVELVRIEEGIGYFTFKGSCQGCAASSSKLLRSIEEAIYQVAPELDEIIAVEAEKRAVQPVKFMPTRRRKPEAVVSSGSGED
ncbi:hypothetical protein KDW_52740 [Dictyobacter vulcani]|uniref:NIF system FeS cluster assembly NifU C-terminal domain-containing protein n=1 Tax=Dictyobacter vulcani TaxID=2607529 RepID=A0A5J4KV79_9CHLR|nr:NifU family protein [Dictyobacter vulcani]GER91112.1 hypothetical protein KDW_52740 [Dictyobacter vulcani]